MVVVVVVVVLLAQVEQLEVQAIGALVEQLPPGVERLEGGKHVATGGPQFGQLLQQEAH